MGITSDDLPPHLKSLFDSAEYQYAIEKLSQYEVPDFSGFIKMPMYGWFGEAFNNDCVDEALIFQMNLEVGMRSNGAVRLKYLCSGQNSRIWPRGGPSCDLLHSFDVMFEHRVLKFGPNLAPFVVIGEDRKTIDEKYGIQ
jgi:hypothetical protein